MEESDYNVIAITAFCMQTSHLKEKPHEIKAKISKSGKIITVSCTCKAGLGERCKHAVATLLFCYRKDDNLEILSSTDKKCKWKDSYVKALKQYDAAPIENHVCFSRSMDKRFIGEATEDYSNDHIFNCNSDDETVFTKDLNSSKPLLKYDSPKYLMINPTSDDNSKIIAIISDELVYSAFAKHKLGRHKSIALNNNNYLIISREEKEAISTIFRYQRSEFMEEIENINVQLSRDCCHETLKDFSEDFEAICEKTKLNYADWHKARQFRITGSVCYKLYTYTKNKNPDWRKQTKALFEPVSFSNEYTEYGKETEKEARELFKDLTKKNIVETGLIISKQNQWLGYSPDGIIITNGIPSELLEIKCPFKGKSKGIDETVQSELKKSLKIEGENIVLRERHKFYGQIQLGMAVVNVKKTFFVYYSSFDKKLFMISVNFNEEYAKKMLTALKKVYFQEILHDVCLTKRKN
ncbi:uncharacterized protein [Prorops nasuta]